MKKIILLFFIFSLSISTYSQNKKNTKKSVQLIKPRNFYLNGGLRSSFGGKSRVDLKIDLPQNTVKWFYSFTTSKGKSGVKNMNLAIQLAGILSGASATSSTLLSKITIPEGVASVDIYLVDRPNLDIFLAKGDLNGKSYSYTMEGTTQNTKSAVVEIDDVKSGTVYLGLKNPSGLSGVNISIEVAAIVEIKPDNKEKKENAELYGNLGWIQFEKGNYKESIEQSNKSISEYELGWVFSNKGLAQLMLGKEKEALETYIKAFSLVKKQANTKHVFKAMLNDLNNALKLKPNLSGADTIKRMLELYN